jgi:hypothetical protein
MAVSLQLEKKSLAAMGFSFLLQVQMIDYTILIPALLACFFIVILVGFIVFELTGAIIGALLYIGGTIYGAFTVSKIDENDL